ncbi:MAG: hypothetical protein JWO31_1501 [Phycisphaerales bacterium]|nr:hypothetical protein [Phycisphaerales bacterium]
MLLRRATTLFRDVVELLYPTACAVCEEHVDDAGPLCPACLSGLERREDEAACPACAKPLAAHGDPCPYCEGDGEPNLEKVVRLGVYAEPIRHLVYRAKYHGRWALAEFFADRLSRQAAVVGLLSQTDCLVPVPLHRRRQVARGYNQADVLARRLAKAHRLKVVRPLVRVRNTDPQVVAKSRAKREQNLRAAFGLVAPAAVAGRHVVIVDDVTTTGATLQSVARALKPAKPASLSAIVVAIADPKGRDFEVI